jgi:hypothetical protein
MSTIDDLPIRRHPLLRLLFLNLALVIIGYALCVLTNFASLGPMRVVKYSVLGVSILVLLKQEVSLLRLIWEQMQGIRLLVLIFLGFALFTTDPYASLARTLTYVVPFLYVALSVGCLLVRYPIREVLHEFLNVLNWVYFLPIASYFITGGSLTDTNIYFISSEGEGTAFVSNHYGWAGTIFLVSGLDLLRNQPLRAWRSVFIILSSGVALYLILISGNRTSWLSLLFVGLVFVFCYRRMALYQKILVALLPLGLIVYLLQDPNSALNIRIKKTQVQAKKGEARARIGTKMFRHFNQNPAYWATGIGMFNNTKARKILRGRGYHNSYFEVLFGSGVVVFGYFFYLLVFRPLFVYLRYFARYYLFLLPLIIIPYFESNLTGGQFLFFPWFVAVVMFSYCQQFARLKERIEKLAEVPATETV